MLRTSVSVMVQSQVPMAMRAIAHKSTHGTIGGEKVHEFTDGERDGHGDGGGDEEETYGKKEGLFLGFCEGDDFAEGRAGVGGRTEGFWEETGEKRALGGRWFGSEMACKGVREDNGARRMKVRVKVTRTRRTESESTGDDDPDVEDIHHLTDARSASSTYMST